MLTIEEYKELKKREGLDLSESELQTPYASYVWREKHYKKKVSSLNELIGDLEKAKHQSHYSVVLNIQLNGVSYCSNFIKLNSIYYIESGDCLAIRFNENEHIELSGKLKITKTTGIDMDTPNLVEYDLNKGKSFSVGLLVYLDEEGELSESA